MENYWNSVALIAGISLSNNDIVNYNLLESLDNYNIPYRISRDDKRILIDPTYCLGNNNILKIIKNNNINMLKRLDESYVYSRTLRSLVSFSKSINHYYKINFQSTTKASIYVTSNIFGEYFYKKSINLKNITPDAYTVFLKTIEDTSLQECYRRGYIKYFNEDLNNFITKYIKNKILH